MENLVRTIHSAGVDFPAMIPYLKAMKERLHASIPAKERSSRGITWVVQEMSRQLVADSRSEEHVRDLAFGINHQLEPRDMLTGVPIFLMAHYGTDHMDEVLAFFQEAAASDGWVVREFAAAGFRQLITPNREAVQPWLQGMAGKTDPNLRRFASETLRPVTALRWLQAEPGYLLKVIGLLFQEPHPYPRTSVGNNLSDLSRSNPDLILSIVKDLVKSGDSNSYWIACRACRNLVRQQPMRIMDILQTDEYHYKDRHYHR